MTYVFVYLAGWILATAATALVAAVKRKSHEMPTKTIAKLALAAGATWPLLAVATVQAGGLLVLAKGLGAVKSGGTDDVDAVDVSSDAREMAAA